MARWATTNLQQQLLSLHNFARLLATLATRNSMAINSSGAKHARGKPAPARAVNSLINAPYARIPAFSHHCNSRRAMRKPAGV